jgi:GTPase
MGFFAKLFGRRRTEDLKTQEIGRVDTYFAKVGVVALKLNRKLEVGEEILVQGHTTDFVQRVKSIQIQHESVDTARRGAEIGIKVRRRCRRGDRVFRVLEA